MKWQVIILLILSLLIGGFLVAPYIEACSLCNSIARDDENECINRIAKANDVDQYSAPVWTRKLLNIVGEDIELPLVTACRHGNYQTVKALLAKGADPNKYLDGNWSPIEAAFIDGNPERLNIAKELVAYGADVDLFGSRQSALFHELSRLIYSKSMMESEREQMREVVMFLLDNGAALADSKGNSVIHYLAFAGEIDLLESLSTTCRPLFDAQNQKGETPLIWAVKGNSVEGVEFLLSLGVDKGVEDANGKDALDYAMENDALAIILLLNASCSG